MLAPDSRILPIRAFSSDGLGDAFTVAAAVKYAADHGADVINLSLGSPVESGLLKDAISDARERGITLVAAVGNDNDDKQPQFPSSSAEVMAVAAVNLEDTKARFSIELEGLTNNPGYQIIVDRINLGRVESRAGFARIMFISDAFVQTLPPALPPATGIRRVEVLDARGQVLLRGEFRPGI